jgi:long-chain acyl-CoA synthetase
MAAPAIAPVDRMVHFKGPINYKRQSVAVPGTKRPGQSGTRMVSDCPRVSLTSTGMKAHYQNEYFGLVTPQTPNSLRTLTEVFDIGLALSRDRKFLGYRPKVSINPDQYAASYSWETYGQIDIRRRAVGSALKALFNSGALGGGETNTVGTWSQNRPG